MVGSFQEINTVYELSVLLSLLCGNTTQLASSLTRLVQEVYPTSLAKGQICNELCATRKDLDALFHGETVPIQQWTRSDPSSGRPQRQFLFTSLWLLESLTSNRPGNLQEYLERKMFLLNWLPQAEGKARSWLEFVFATYRALQDNNGRALGILLTSPLSDWLPKSLQSQCQASDFFWLRVMTHPMVNKVRAHSLGVMRRSFLRIAVRPEFAALLRDDLGKVDVVSGPPSNQDSIDWLETMLVLHADLAAALTVDFQHPLSTTTSDSHMERSMCLFYGLATVMGQQQWEGARSQIAPRLVQGTNAFALTLRP